MERPLHAPGREIFLEQVERATKDAGVSRASLPGPPKSKKLRAPCDACTELLDCYISGARAHANATQELKALLDAGLHDQFAAMLEVTGDVRKRCEVARRAFRAHRRRHKHPERGTAPGTVN